MIYASYTASLPSKNNPLAASSSKIIMAGKTRESNTETINNITRYITIEFEVFGRVQGVFFRKYTKEKAEELGLTGWCRNTHRGTVKGEFEFAYPTAAENDNDKTDKESWEALAFQHWLCRVGSPRSRIDDCTFSEKKFAPPSSARQYDAFRVIR